MKGFLVVCFLVCLAAILGVFALAPIYEEQAIMQVIANRMRIIYMLILAGCAAVLLGAIAITDAINRLIETSSKILEAQREVVERQRPAAAPVKPLFDRPPAP